MELVARREDASPPAEPGRRRRICPRHSLSGRRRRVALISGLGAAVSPDGRWIAYSSAESGSSEVWVRPFPNVTDARWPVSIAGGDSPKWAPSSRELFYRQGPWVMRVSIDTDPRFQPGRPERLFEGNYQAFAGAKYWDLAPDGRFLMKKALRAEYSVNVVLNQEELKQRVPR